MFSPRKTPRSVLATTIRHRLDRPIRNSLSDEDAAAWLLVLRAKSHPAQTDIALIEYLERGGRSIRP